MEALVDDPNGCDFEIDTDKRDEFFTVWKNGPFDLYLFTAKESGKMNKRLQWYIERMPELDNVAMPKNFLKAVKDGKVDPTLFEQYGAVLPMQWVLGSQKKAEEKHVEKAQDRRDRGDDIDYQIAEEGFTADGRPLTLKDVNWEDPVIAELLQKPDADIPHPEDVKQHQRHVDPDSFWVTKRQIFQEMLPLDKT